MHWRRWHCVSPAVALLRFSLVHDLLNLIFTKTEVRYDYRSKSAPSEPRSPASSRSPDDLFGLFEIKRQRDTGVGVSVGSRLEEPTAECIDPDVRMICLIEDVVDPEEWR